MTHYDVIRGLNIDGWRRYVVADDETRKCTVYRQGTVALIGFYQTRGTADWEKNFRAWTLDFSIGSEKYKAHAGFVEEYASLRDTILADMMGVEVVQSYGFSQGGAHAVLCHRDLLHNYPHLSVHTETFGAPRVYSWESAREFNKANKESAYWCSIVQHRFRGDPVPHLPPKWLGYGDVGEIIVHGPWSLPFNVSVHSMDARHYGGV